MAIERLNDFEKAQVFIGYLAAFPKKENKPDNQVNNFIEGV
jgi:hypothetical protein